jgi:hypothetical protein
MSVVFSRVLLAATLLTPATRLVTPPAPPAAVPAAACTVAPRTAGAVAEIVATADRAKATPLPSTAAYTQPAGVPADAATVAGVTATVRQLAACVNAGDFMRFLALFTDDALRRYAADLALPLKADDPRITPDPSTNDRVAVEGVADVLVLPDGRVSALVKLPNLTAASSPAADLTLQLIFVHQDDRWLIDELVPIAPAPSTWTPVAGAGYQGVIVPAATAPDFARWLTGREAAGGWDPTPDDVARLEAALPAFLASAPNTPGDLMQKLPGYKRQYAGIIDGDGRSLILVNAFCDAGGTDWQSQPVLVLDGGDCFFHISYDPAAGTFSGLTINGST